MRPSIWLLAAAQGPRRASSPRPTGARGARAPLRGARARGSGPRDSRLVDPRSGGGCRARRPRAQARDPRRSSSRRRSRAPRGGGITTLSWKVRDAEAEPSTGVFTMLDRDITRGLRTLLVCRRRTARGTALAASALAQHAGAPRRGGGDAGFAAGSIFLAAAVEDAAVANAERVARRAVPSKRGRRVLAPVGASSARSAPCPRRRPRRRGATPRWASRSAACGCWSPARGARRARRAGVAHGRRSAGPARRLAEVMTAARRRRWPAAHCSAGAGPHARSEAQPRLAHGMIADDVAGVLGRRR